MLTIYSVQGNHAKAPDVSHLQRASVLATDSRIKLTGHGPILPPPASLPGIQQFPSLQFVKDWEVNFHIISNWNKLVLEVTQGRGYAVSNSSFKAHQGAAA